MQSKRYPRYWLEKRAKRKTGFPVATIAYYGPNDHFASKVVVGILSSEKREDEPLLKKWFATDVDVRYDEEILQEMLAFIEQHNAVRVAMMDRIIGCPHEEGIDYPLGDSCPQCPFWAHRDRWTGKLLS